MADHRPNVATPKGKIVATPTNVAKLASHKGGGATKHVGKHIAHHKVHHAGLPMHHGSKHGKLA